MPCKANTYFHTRKGNLGEVGGRITLQHPPPPLMADSCPQFTIESKGYRPQAAIHYLAKDNCEIALQHTTCKLVWRRQEAARASPAIAYLLWSLLQVRQRLTSYLTPPGKRRWEPLKDTMTFSTCPWAWKEGELGLGVSPVSFAKPAGLAWSTWPPVWAVKGKSAFSNGHVHQWRRLPI